MHAKTYQLRLFLSSAWHLPSEHHIERQSAKRSIAEVVSDIFAHRAKRLGAAELDEFARIIARFGSPSRFKLFHQFLHWTSCFPIMTTLFMSWLKIVNKRQEYRRTLRNVQRRRWRWMRDASSSFVGVSVHCCSQFRSFLFCNCLWFLLHLADVTVCGMLRFFHIVATWLSHTRPRVSGHATTPSEWW